MSIELVMVDMGDVNSALNILLHCFQVMPTGFFTRVSIVCPPTDVPMPSGVNHIRCSFQAGNMFGYNVWLVREFPRYIICDHCLTIHRDGFILNPDRWENEFLNYDYIGAPWAADQAGGNGAFCIMTKRFHRWIARHPIPIEDTVPQDNYICKTLHGTATACGFRYAPLSVAARFALENQFPERNNSLHSVFGFHGKWYLDQNPVLKQW